MMQLVKLIKKKKILGITSEDFLNIFNLLEDAQKKLIMD